MTFAVWFVYQKPKAPLTGKVASRGNLIKPTSKLNNTTSLRETQNKFGTTHDRLREAQTKLKERNVSLDKFKYDPESRIAKAEAEINNLINDSNIAFATGNASEALDKAKEASAKMATLERYLEKNELSDFLNVELQFSVGLNLASMYERNELWAEARGEYERVGSTKACENQFLTKINIGNIHFRCDDMQQAIKVYKMALDMAPQKYAALKYKIMKNIAHAYVRLKDYAEASAAYEEILGKFPDLETAYNLMLCLYSLGDKEKLKRTFTEMLGVQTFWSVPAGQLGEEEGEKRLQEDPLVSELSIRKTQAVKLITDCAKLIAPVICPSMEEGYEWVIAALKNSNYPDIQSEMEMSKALVFVKTNKINEAISLLKVFEKKNKKFMTSAATNLAFLYLLEQNYQAAESYCDVALRYDRYNSKALVNKGNCHFYRRDFVRAKESYLEAIGVEADCAEALYNLAYVNKQISAFSEAFTALEKLQTVLNNFPEVLYQMASVYELQGDNKNAIKWYDLLQTKAPNDPNLHAKLGFLYYLENDEQQAYHHYYESFKVLPSNIDTIAWLGIYHVRGLNYERACYFFERAALIQPKDIKWRLMIASCQRRLENYEKAIRLYEEIHNDDQENLESLKFLVQLSQLLDKPCEQYVSKLKRLERNLEAMEGGFMEFHGQDMENVEGARMRKEEAPAVGGTTNGQRVASRERSIQQSAVMVNGMEG